MIEPEDAQADLTEQARRWLDAFADAQDLDSSNAHWATFSLAPTTVTLFGAYDTGKSSLIRRLLVDAGVPVPDWLTISARHETFEASEADYLDVILRDTPGVSPVGADARSEANTSKALAATIATDVLAIVVTPQLLTGERDIVARLLTLPWEENSLWFVISRFDDAGVDPEGDLDGYRRLAGSKTEELRDQLLKQLDRSLDVKVFVVSADPFGFTGGSPSPDHADWDPYREWDGMNEIATSIRALSPRAEALRAAAAQRFWLNEVRRQLAKMAVLYEEARGVEVTARQERERVGHMLSRVDEMLANAKNDLISSVNTVVDRAMTSSLLREDGFKKSLRETLELWDERQSAEIGALGQDLEGLGQRELGRPTWQNIDGILRDFTATAPYSASDQPEPASSFSEVKNRLLRLNDEFAKTTSNLKKLFETNLKGAPRVPKSAVSTAGETAKSQSAKDPLSKASKFFKGADVLVTVGPLALEAYELIDETIRRREKATESANRREEIESRLEALKEHIADDAFAAFASRCDIFRTHLEHLTASIDALIASADERNAFLDLAREEAKPLLAA